ncbi:hypothetical protein KC318_g6892 [Hortaea werneckii]|uniref:SMP-30/Gluconolactonase/LRE-like region domain-containing protein n=1 Tax=Hortaea werneckii TaxID=91943 RepID=A0A3M7B9R5_HORWE|nr:hypothetical protein KC334_g8757 [Hortaea werneckii]KAI7004539.1 hypothetical protein KC355_g8673 [Hortaea werneckii]KAI7665803.1 hypothetical protein KC318_g6892 [Hortaea werneckii]RMY36414.1 hypothetical protein D0866_03945 [Hortaea werneckii]
MDKVNPDVSISTFGNHSMYFPFGSGLLSLLTVTCVAVAADDDSPFFSPLSEAFSNSKVVLLKDKLAVIPGDWEHDNIGEFPMKQMLSWRASCILTTLPATNLHDIKASDPSVASALAKLADASFVAWDEQFLDVIGSDARVETIQTFESPEDTHVHEAPVYVAETNELVFSDTSQIGWLWAVNIDSHETRKITTNPPLYNVNGATYHNGLLHACTNGGSVRGIFTVNLTDGATQPLLNNFRGRHFNSPNDRIFDSRGNIFFTDPTYGHISQWPGVQDPELPNSIYHFDPHTKSLRTLSNSPLLFPNGLALSVDEQTLYVADSNSSFSSLTSVRNVWAFDVEHQGAVLSTPRLVYQAESGWPDGIRVSRSGLLFVAVAGGVDVVAPATGLLLGKINVPGDIVFNLEPADGGERDGVWLLTGNKAVYKVTIAEGRKRDEEFGGGAMSEKVGSMAEEYLGGAMGAMQNAYQRVMA